MIFDTHAHYNDEQFDEDRKAVLEGLPLASVGHVVNASASVKDWEQVIELTKAYPYIYGMIGVHPDEVGELNEENFSLMRDLLQKDKIVAVGEIGLDYYWDKEARELQKEWFIRQLKLAEELKMPVNIHSRDAAADTFDILKEYGKNVTCIVHCYSYSREMALDYVKMGYLIGVGGVVTFKNAKKLKEVVEAVPIGHIVLETDCPYMSPEPFRGKRNDSSRLSYVAAAIGALKGLSAEEVIRITEENAKRFYRIP